MLTPRPRPRSNGSIAWQVPFHYYDESGRRRSTSETFDDYEAAARWCELAEAVGVAEARRIREIQLGTAVGCMTLVEWLRKYTARADRYRGTHPPRLHPLYRRRNSAPEPTSRPTLRLWWMKTRRMPAPSSTVFWLRRNPAARAGRFHGSAGVEGELCESIDHHAYRLGVQVRRLVRRLASPRSAAVQGVPADDLDFGASVADRHDRAWYCQWRSGCRLPGPACCEFLSVGPPLTTAPEQVIQRLRLTGKGTSH